MKPTIAFLFFFLISSMGVATPPNSCSKSDTDDQLQNYVATQLMKECSDDIECILDTLDIACYENTRCKRVSLGSLLTARPNLMHRCYTWECDVAKSYIKQQGLDRLQHVKDVVENASKQKNQCQPET